MTILPTIYTTLALFFFAAFFVARSLIGIAMANGHHDRHSGQLAWVFCSPLLAISLIFFIASIPP